MQFKALIGPSAFNNYGIEFFLKDAASGNLPNVSYIVANKELSERADIYKTIITYP
jgi:hypothetical protein